MTTAWITGARGFIGRHLAHELAAQATAVAGIGHGAWPDHEAAQWGVTTWLNGEISAANLDRLVRQVGLPDQIFHVAGGSSVGMSLQTPEEDFRRSVNSTMQLLEWVRTHAPAAPVVLASSAAVYGAGHTRPISEAAALHPYSPYGYHKRMTELLGESYAQHFGLQVAVVRLFSVYGPELRKQLLWDLCTRLRSQPAVLSLAGTGQEARDWIYVADAARLLAQAAQPSAPYTVVNGGAGQAVTVAEVVAQLGAAWGWLPEVRFTGEPRVGDPQYLVADPAQAQRLGYQPQTDLAAGIAAYVAWFRQAVA